MALRLRSWRRARDILTIVAGLAALALMVRLLWLSRTPPKRVLTLTAGRASADRSRLAEALIREARTQGLTLRLVETDGSEDALRKLASGEKGLDLALVQGGLSLEDALSGSLREVAVLQDEPLHLLIHDEALAQQVEANGLAALRNTRICLSRPGSGTYRLARAILQFAGLEPGEYHTLDRSPSELVDDLPDPPPDAVFLVGVLPSTTAEALVQNHGYHVASIPYDSAFPLWQIRGEPSSGVVARFIRPGRIPALLYDRAPPVPPEDRRTVATPMLLVAHRRVPVDVVERLLDVVYDSAFARAGIPPLDPAALDERPELDWHEGTLHYRDRNRPLIAGDAIDLLEKAVTIGGSALGALFFLWHFIQRRIRVLREQGFEAYILKVTAIERQALELEAAPVLDLAVLLSLQRDVLRLKTKALERFASGDLEGEQLMTGFLAQVNDTREYLTRLILSRRDALEERALQEGRPPDALWREALAEADRARDTAVPLPESAGPAHP